MIPKAILVTSKHKISFDEDIILPYESIFYNSGRNEVGMFEMQTELSIFSCDNFLYRLLYLVYGLEHTKNVSSRFLLV